MEPYATAAQPGPLNQSRPAVGGSGVTDFFYLFCSEIFWGSALHSYTAIIWNIYGASMKKCPKRRR